MEMASEDVKVTAYAVGMTFNGKDEFKAFMEGFKNAIPDMAINHTNIISNGNNVAVEFTVTGTQTGALQTPNGAIPPSGKSINLNVAEFIEWDKNGKFKNISNYQDIGNLLRQIGAM